MAGVGQEEIGDLHDIEVPPGSQGDDDEVIVGGGGPHAGPSGTPMVMEKA